MRYDAEQKSKTRERVLKQAARAIRVEGPHCVSVAAVMSSAGLTHGGFYAHFDSKDALIAAAIEQMFAESWEHWLAETKRVPPAEGLASFIDLYLSTRHRDAAGRGCPMAALAADIPRLTSASRRAFAAGVGRLTASMKALLEQLGIEDAESMAASVLSEMLRALSLARAEPHRASADALLGASRQALKRRLGLPLQH